MTRNPVKAGPTAFRKPALAVFLLAATTLAGCATNRTPQFSYDADVPALPVVRTAVTDGTPRPLHTPPGWTVARGGAAATTPEGVSATPMRPLVSSRAGRATTTRSRSIPGPKARCFRFMPLSGRSQPSRSKRASLTGAGPIAAGDTTRWIIGDTESGSGTTRRVHVLVKPTRADISTNLVITTDRRTYLIELRASNETWMPAVAWAYPAPPATQRVTAPAAPIIPAESARNYRYGLAGDNPPWKPLTIFDDGRRVYVVFPRGIVQGEMPPLFVIGSGGEPEIVNSRIYQNVLIVDRLFGAAELRLGSGNRQQTVRIVRVQPGQTAATGQTTATGGAPS